MSQLCVKKCCNQVTQTQTHEDWGILQFYCNRIYEHEHIRLYATN